MNRIALCLLGLGASLLGGCASVVTADAPVPGSFVVDQQRVGAIERAARSSGVGLIWVNQPMKKVPVGG
jgi:uncharacterized protein YceK